MNELGLVPEIKTLMRLRLGKILHVVQESVLFSLLCLPRPLKPHLRGEKHP